MTRLIIISSYWVVGNDVSNSMQSPIRIVTQSLLQERVMETNRFQCFHQLDHSPLFDG